MKVIDLTQTISADMPVFPGTAPAGLEVANTFETDGFRETMFHRHPHGCPLPSFPGTDKAGRNAC